MMGVLLGTPPSGSKSPTLIMLLPRQQKRPYRSWEVICFGPKRHYRRDGSCPHTAAVLASLKSQWHRRRTRVVPHGGEEAPND